MGSEMCIRDSQISAGGQLVEVVAGHVGVEVKGRRRVGCRDPESVAGPFADVQVDIPSSRITERSSDRRDRRGELGGREGPPVHPVILPIPVLPSLVSVSLGLPCDRSMSGRSLKRSAKRSFRAGH